LAHEVGAYLLVGGAGYDKSNPRKEGHLAYSNSEFLVSPYGLLMGQYNKIRLLPFNEYLPLQGMITWPQWITTLRENFMAGEAYTLFQLPRAKFAAPVCWENMFPELFRRFVREGAQFMVSVTNEEFFGRTSGPYQTLAMNVFRAVENRVAIVRAATTGVSGFINPDGEIVERIRDGNGEDLFVAGILVRDVLLSNHKTFYTVYGDIFAYAVICTAASIILACLSSRNGRALT
jgi:apolipoprotein N-acyltransferase